MMKILILAIFSIVLTHGYVVQAGAEELVEQNEGGVQSTRKLNLMNLLYAFKNIDFNQEAVVYLPRLFDILENVIRAVTEHGIHKVMDLYITPIMEEQLIKAENYLKENMKDVTLMQLIERIPTNKIMQLIQPDQKDNGQEKMSEDAEAKAEFQSLFVEIRKLMILHQSLVVDKPVDVQKVSQNIEKMNLLMERMDEIAQNSRNERMKKILQKMKSDMVQLPKIKKNLSNVPSSVGPIEEMPLFAQTASSMNEGTARISSKNWAGKVPSSVSI